MIRIDITVQLSVEDSACIHYQLTRNAIQCKDIYEESKQLGTPGAAHWLTKAEDLQRLARLFPDFREEKP